MTRIKAGNVEIEYECFGEKGNEPLVLISGSGAQMNFWEPEFCEMLMEKGFYVIRFDNRDCGLSTKFKAPANKCPYTLYDMAADVLGIMDALKIEKAHICGASMGGMIAQIFACSYTDRTLSLTSIMSSDGNPSLPTISKETLELVARIPPDGRKEYIEYTVDMWRKLWSRGFPFEEARARRYTEESFDRCYYPLGAAHHNAVAAAAGDRRSELAKLNIPALIIHGTSDPMFPQEAGIDTAKAIPGSKLLLIKGMGHDMPVGTWNEITEAIAKNAGL